MATDKIKAIMREHPEDPIVRIATRNLTKSKLQYSITLEGVTQPNDNVQEINEITVVIEERSAPMMDGVTIDFDDIKGFTFIHP